MGKMAQRPPPTSGHRADRRRVDYALHRELLDLQVEGDRVRDLKQHAHVRRLLGPPGVVDEEPTSLDEGTEGHSVRTPTEADRSRAYGGDVAGSREPRRGLQLAFVGDGASDAIRHGLAPRRAGATQP